MTTGKLVLDGWAGRERISVEIVSVSPKRYRVRLLEDALLPSRRHCSAGDVVSVPRHAVKLDEPAADADQAQA